MGILCLSLKYHHWEHCNLSWESSTLVYIMLERWIGCSTIECIIISALCSVWIIGRAKSNKSQVHVGCAMVSVSASSVTITITRMHLGPAAPFSLWDRLKCEQLRQMKNHRHELRLGKQRARWECHFSKKGVAYTKTKNRGKVNQEWSILRPFMQAEQ